MLASLLNALKGKKTILVSVGIAALQAAYAAGRIDPATYQAIMGLLAALGLYTVRDAIGWDETNKATNANPQ